MLIENASLARFNERFAHVESAKAALFGWRTRHAKLADRAEEKQDTQDEKDARDSESALSIRAQLRLALEEFASECASILECEPMLADFWDAGRAEAFLAGIASEATAARALAETLQAKWRNALLKAGTETFDALSQRETTELDFLRAQESFEPSPEILPWRALAQRTGFDPLRRLIQTFLQSSQFGTITDAAGGSHAVTFANHREFLKHRDHVVREGAFVCADAFARRHAEMLFSARRARIRAILETRALCGATDFLASHLEKKQLPAGLPALLEPHSKRAARIGSAFVKILAKRLDLVSLSAADLDAPLNDQVTPTLATTWEAIAHVAQSFSPDWERTVRACETSGTVLVDPAQARSPYWYMQTSYEGKAPLVHSPFKNDLESVQATAHEMGHACHLTHLVRTRGPYDAQRVPLQFVEIFSLAFEIATLKHLAENATSLAEKRAWHRARLDQGLHFTRRMLLRARFDALLFAKETPSFEELDQARTRDEHDSFAGALPLEGVRNATWLFDFFPEEMPFYGFEYSLAYLVASTLVELKPPQETFLAFAQDGGFQPLGKALRDHFALDLENPCLFDPAWEALERDLTAFST